jgi:dihydroorotase-like cyclic amidohydrolase
MTDPDVHGPIDFVVLEFPAGSGVPATAKALLDLVDAGTVRVYDFMVVTKDETDTFEVDLTAVTEGPLAPLTVFAGARSGLLDDEDVAQAADVLEPGETAAIVVYENTWAVPLVAAARGEGAEVVASARLTAQEIMDALDAVEAAG